MEEIEDYYTYFVEILGISENLFWNADISFVLTVAENKSAYDGWVNYVREKEMERVYGKER